MRRLIWAAAPLLLGTACQAAAINLICEDHNLRGQAITTYIIIDTDAKTLEVREPVITLRFKDGNEDQVVEIKSDQIKFGNAAFSATIDRGSGLMTLTTGRSLFCIPLPSRQF
jgi:hypothetical protein